MNTAAQTISRAYAKVVKIVEERKAVGFPALTDEVITEVAAANGISAEALENLYYGF